MQKFITMKKELFYILSFCLPIRKLTTSTFLLLIATGLALTTSCTAPQTKARLQEVEEHMEAEPSHALSVLREINGTSLRSASLKAQYALLLSMALDKNAIDTANTAVIRPALKYYMAYGPDEKRGMTMFYLGRQQYNAGAYEESAISYLKALGYFRDTDNRIYEGLACGSLSELCSVSYNFQEALNYVEEAIDCFKEVGDSVRMKASLFRKAQYCTNLALWEEAASIYDTLLEDNSLPWPLRWRVLCSFGQFLVLCSQKDEQKAIQTFESAIGLYGCLSKDSDYGAYAYCLAVAGEEAASDSILSRMSSEGLDYLFWKSRILQQQGKYREALEIKDKMVTPPILHNVFSQSVVLAQRDYFNERSALMETKLDVRTLLLLSVILLCLLIGLSLFMLLSGRHRRQCEENERIRSLLDRAEMHLMDEEKNNSEMREKLAEVQREYFRIYRKQFSQLGDLYEIVKAEDVRSQKHGGDLSEMVYRKVKDVTDIINSGEEEQLEFEMAINEKMNDVMLHFREDFPKMRFEEYKFISCLFAGFDATLLSQIFDISKAAVRTRKSRFKKVIEDSESAHREEFLRLFD